MSRELREVAQNKWRRVREKNIGNEGEGCTEM